MSFALGCGLASLVEPTGGEALPGGAESRRLLLVWVIVGVGCAGAAVWLRRMSALRPCSRLSRSGVTAALILAAFALGGARGTSVLATLDQGLTGTMARWSAEHGPHRACLVTLRGLLVDAPRAVEPRGFFASLDRRPRPFIADLDVRRINLPPDGWSAIGGRVHLLMDDRVAVKAGLCAGDAVEVTGLLAPVAPPMNPGQFDFARRARREGRAGTIRIESIASMKQLTRSPWPVRSFSLRWRAALRSACEAAIVADLPPSATPDRDALCSAMLLGNRSAALEPLMDLFRRTGLAHLVAISGFNLGVLAAAVLVIARLRRRRLRREAIVTLAVIVPYLVIVVPEVPVMRAGIMVIVTAIGLLLDRRWRVTGVLAASAAVILAWDPTEAVSPGFQLSFAAVAALAIVAPVLRDRWFGAPDRMIDGAIRFLVERGRTGVAAATAAWVTTAPIVAVHFGFLSPWGVPLSLVTAPVASTLLCAGYAKIAVTCVSPAAGALCGRVMAGAADALISMVELAAGLPASGVDVPPPPPAWAIACSVATLLWVMVVEPRRRWLVNIACAGLAAWPFTPMLHQAWNALEAARARHHPRMITAPAPWRIDMLAVGDGTCIIVRSGDTTVLFDAGSGASSIARRVILPALESLGVTRIDALIVSHANLDHFAAVPEITRAMQVGEVLVTPQLIRAADAAPRSAAALLLDDLVRRGIQVRAASAGFIRVFGETTWTWLHPPGATAFRTVNDTSQVIRVRGGARTLLLCGDIQDEAIATLLASDDAAAGARLHADIIELPHHGSWREIAAALVERTRATIVLQSTGPSRLENDRWTGRLMSVNRHVTARDGAIHVDIAADGTISTGWWRRDGTPGAPLE